MINNLFQISHSIRSIDVLDFSSKWIDRHFSDLKQIITLSLKQMEGSLIKLSLKRRIFIKQIAALSKISTWNLWNLYNWHNPHLNNSIMQVILFLIHSFVLCQPKLTELFLLFIPQLQQIFKSMLRLLTIVLQICLFQFRIILQ